MKELFIEKASLPSEAEKETSGKSKEKIRIEREMENLKNTCAGALMAAGYNLDANLVQQTLNLLIMYGSDIIQHGSKIPFSLSADSLARDVRRCDLIGPAQLRFYYERQLMNECKFLVPRRVTENDLLVFYRTTKTWSINSFYFRCAVISPVLSIKLLHFQRRLEGRYGNQNI